MRNWNNPDTFQSLHLSGVIACHLKTSNKMYFCEINKSLIRLKEDLFKVETSESDNAAFFYFILISTFKSGTK